MRRLILFLLLPAIFAKRQVSKDPNDQPFLPIYPVYPYTPKLIKRGAERESIPEHLTTEQYAPQVDAKDTYGTGYSENYQRDAYYQPDYSPDSKNTPPPSPPSAVHQPYYGGDAFVYTNAPYGAYSPYHVAPYAVNPTSSYPDYYFQPPYYYPHYFNHALFPPPPPPPQPPQIPSGAVDYHETPPSQDTAIEAEDDTRDKDGKIGEGPKEDATTSQNVASTGNFVDGGNYISGSTRDLDVQSSTYKTAGPYNQLEQENRAKSAASPLPKTAYRVVSVVGATPVGTADYPLPASYVKAQQRERLEVQLDKLLAQNAQRQTDLRTATYVSGAEAASGSGGANQDGSYARNQEAYSASAQSYATVPGVAGKVTGIIYAITPVGAKAASGDRTKTHRSPSSHRATTSSSSSSSSSPSSTKTAKYSNVVYVEKPSPASSSQTTSAANHPRTTSDKYRGKHRDRGTGESRPATAAAAVRTAEEYGGGYDPSSQSYGGDALSQSAGKREQNYAGYRSQAEAYQGKEFIGSPQTPRTYTYQYSAYEASDQTTAQQQQQPQQDQVEAADGSFGIRQYVKG